MRHLETIEIKALGWGDATFRGFAWENEGKDLRLFVEHANLAIVTLMCHWVSDLRIDLSWQRPAGVSRSGPLLTWEMSIELDANDRWTVVMDFAHVGQLSFGCERMTANYDEVPSPALRPELSGKR